MQARARVRDVRDGRVRLECESPAGACGACAGRGGCALRWLAGKPNTALEVSQPASEALPLRPGVGVIVEVEDGELLRAAALAYLPPLFGMLAGAGGAVAVASGSEAAALVGAAVGLAVGWGAARWWLRRSPPRYCLQVGEGP